MPRPPAQQHRALTAASSGRIIRLHGGRCRSGSWQWWTGDQWRYVTGAEHNALNALTREPTPLIEAINMLGGVREEFVTSPAGETVKQMWDHQYGPVTL